MLWPFRKPAPPPARDPEPPPASAFSAQAANGCWVIRCAATGVVVAYSDDAAWAAEIAHALNEFHR